MQVSGTKKQQAKPTKLNLVGGAIASEQEMVCFRSVSKHFGGTIALSDVSITSHLGTVHAITGENGAGKSTLMKMLSGVHAPDGGEIIVDGNSFDPKSPKDAQMLGVSTIFQELNLIPNLSVAENLFFGREPVRFGLIDRKTLINNAQSLLDDLGLTIDPHLPAGALTIAEQQFIEIAKGLSYDAKIYIFDEPTAALNSAETERLFEIIDKLRADKKLVYYISHRLEEIFHLSDKISVMKDGSLAAEFLRGETDEAGLVRAMVGRDMGDYFPPRRESLPEVIKLNVKGLRTKAWSSNVDLTLREGEILGIAGLEGQGQRDIIRAIVGLDDAHSGECMLSETSIPLDKGIAGVVKAGIGFVPEDRKSEGLFLNESIDKNLSLGQIRSAKLYSRAVINRDVIENIAKDVRLKSASMKQNVGSLSGGNQQKVMLGRWLSSGIDALVIEEPTRGVDVGAKAEIYTALRAYCGLGHAVLITSSEMNELIGLCDRILVAREGKLVAELDAKDASEEVILAHAISSNSYQELK